MRILFLYTKIDDTLRDRVERLRAHNAEVSTLSLLEYKLDENGKEVTFDIESKLDFLEKTGKLRAISRINHRKKLLSYLEDYDIIDIYKCEKSCLMLVDQIENLCHTYFVTVSEQREPISLIQKPLYKNLYDRAGYLLFSTLNQMEAFSFSSDEKRHLVPNGIKLFREIDAIGDQHILQASRAMGLDLEKDIIYCDLSGALEKQEQLIDDISELPTQKLKQSTFIFTLSRHNLEERESIKTHLEGKNFDYLLIEALMSDKQKALLFRLANSAIVINYDQNNPTLPLALYAKHIVYLYDEHEIDDLFFVNDFFFKTFEDFKNTKESDNATIEQDLLTKNREKVFKIFDPEATIETYIDLIKSL